MKKLAVIALIVFMTGCASEAPKQTDQDVLVDDIYRAVIKYQVMNGTPEEQAKPPITDRQLSGFKEWLKEEGKSGTVSDYVYKP